MKAESARDLRYIWWVALGCFVLAGATGALYRYAITFGGDVFGLSLMNIRHAHSHLMYFGWVTPALMAVITVHLPGLTGRPLPAAAGHVLNWTLAAGMLSYPAFLLYGYQSVPIGSKSLPLSVMIAGLNMIIWYVFVARYFQMTRHVRRTTGLRLWDLSLLFLVLSTLGAWSLSLLKPLGISSEIVSSALMHIFLDLFSEGWFVLALLGAFYAAIPASPDVSNSAKGTWLIGIGLPFTFAMGMPAQFLSQEMQIVARLACGMVSIGLLLHARVLLPQVDSWLWRIPLALLSLKALAALAAAILPGIWLSSIPGLRILYLHLMLLGFVSLGLFTAAHYTWGEAASRGHRWMTAAVLLLLVSLVPFTPMWPQAFAGRWMMLFAAAAAWLPMLAAAGMLVLPRQRAYAMT